MYGPFVQATLNRVLEIIALLVSAKSAEQLRKLIPQYLKIKDDQKRKELGLQIDEILDGLPSNCTNQILCRHPNVDGVYDALKEAVEACLSALYPLSVNKEQVQDQHAVHAGVWAVGTTRLYSEHDEEKLKQPDYDWEKDTDDEDAKRLRYVQEECRRLGLPESLVQEASTNPVMKG